jgi:hypothetical protein
MHSAGAPTILLGSIWDALCPQRFAKITFRNVKLNCSFYFLLPHEWGDIEKIATQRSLH